jgi:death-on-curing protein
MIRYLTLNEVLLIHERLIKKHGGSHGIRDLGLLDSALNQIQQTFGQNYVS